MISKANDRLVLITGAGGFIGGWAAEILHLEGRYRVRAGVRKWSSAARIARFPMDIALCDVMNPASIENAMKDVTDVVHCVTGESAAIITGTKNVLEAALKYNARVIHLSSIAVYGNATGEVGEDTPFSSNGSEYSEAKIEAEQLCQEFVQAGGKLFVLRPTIVYGPYSSLWTTNIALRLMTGQWGNLGAAANGLCNLVYVLDVIQAIQCALNSDVDCVGAFNVNGPEVMTWNDYFKAFNEMLGLPPLKDTSPAVARWKSRLLYPARCFGKFMLNHHRDFLIAAANRSDRLKAAMKAAESTFRATATSDQFSLYGLQARYPTEFASQRIGYHPEYSIQRSLELSCNWLKHAGVLG